MAVVGGSSGHEPNKGFHRICFLLVVGIAVALVVAFCLFAFLKQPKVPLGNTMAHPGVLLPTTR